MFSPVSSTHSSYTPYSPPPTHSSSFSSNINQHPFELPPNEAKDAFYLKHKETLIRTLNSKEFSSLDPITSDFYQLFCCIATFNSIDDPLEPDAVIRFLDYMLFRLMNLMGVYLRDQLQSNHIDFSSVQDEFNEYITKFRKYKSEIISNYGIDKLIKNYGKPDGLLDLLTLLLYLPSPLASKLNFDHLAASLIEIAGNKDNCLYTTEVMDCTYMFDLMNAEHDVIPCPSDFSMIIDQPIFQKFIPVFLSNFAHLFQSKKKHFYISCNLPEFLKERASNSDYNALLALNYLSHLSKILNNQTYSNKLLECFRVYFSHEFEPTLKGIVFKIQTNFPFGVCFGFEKRNNILEIYINDDADSIKQAMELLQNLIFPVIQDKVEYAEIPHELIFSTPSYSNYSGSKRKIDRKESPSKNLKASKNQTAHIENNTGEEIDYRVSKIVSLLPSTIQTLAITGSSSTPWHPQELDQLFSKKTESVKIPIEYITLGHWILEPQTTKQLIFTVSSQYINKLHNQPMEKISWIHRCGCRVAEIEWNETCDKNNLFEFINQLKIEWNIKYSFLDNEKGNIEFAQLIDLIKSKPLEMQALFYKGLRQGNDLPKFNDEAVRQILTLPYLIQNPNEISYIVDLLDNTCKSNARLVLNLVSKIQIPAENIIGCATLTFRNLILLEKNINEDKEESLTNQAREAGWRLLVNLLTEKQISTTIFDYPLDLLMHVTNAGMRSTTFKSHLTILAPLAIEFLFYFATYVDNAESTDDEESMECEETREGDDWKPWRELLKLLINKQLIQYNPDFQEVLTKVVINNNTFKQFHDCITSAPPVEAKKIAQALKFLATPFCEIRELTIKDAKYLMPFVEVDWIPPVNQYTLKHDWLPFLLLEVINTSLPNLNHALRAWVPILLQNLEKQYSLSEKEQIHFGNIFHYHCVQKLLAVPKYTSQIDLNYYPFLLGKLVHDFIFLLPKQPENFEFALLLTRNYLKQESFDKNKTKIALLVLRNLFAIVELITHIPTRNHCFQDIASLIATTPHLNLLFQNTLNVSNNNVNALPSPISKMIALSYINKVNVTDDVTLDSLAKVFLLSSKFNIDLNEINNPLISTKIIYSLWKNLESKLTRGCYAGVVELLLKDYKTSTERFIAEESESLEAELEKKATLLIELINNEYLQTPNNQYNNFLKLVYEILKLPFKKENLFNKALVNYLENFKGNPISKIRNHTIFFEILGAGDLSKKAQIEAYKIWKFFVENDTIILLFPKKQKEFLKKIFKYIEKYPVRFRNPTTLKTILFSFQSLPIEGIKSILYPLFDKIDRSLFNRLNRSFPSQIEYLLGRPLNEDEISWANLHPFKTSKNHFLEVKHLVLKPKPPSEGAHKSNDISILLKIFDQINFEYPDSPHYMPSSFKIDGKPVDIPIIKEFLHQLIENVKNQQQITAAPQDPVQRQHFYAEIHNYLKHITFILLQREPHECLGYIQQLAEIGSKCATQYNEIPALYHCLVQETDKVLVPSSISKFNNLILRSQFDFTSELESLIIKKIDDNEIVFNRSVKNKDLIKSSLEKKLNFMTLFLAYFSEDTAWNIIEKLNNLKTLTSGEELVKTFNSIYDSVSPCWVLVYLFDCEIDYSISRRLIDQVVQTSLIGQSHNLEKPLREFTSRLYGLDKTKTQPILIEFAKLPFDNEVKLIQGLALISEKLNKLTGFSQPTTLKDKFLLILHNARWKYFRDEMAAQPDYIESNIHNSKYIKTTLSNHLGIFQSDQQAIPYNDTHVSPDAGRAAESIRYNFNYNYNVLFIFDTIKNAIGTDLSFGEVYNWLMQNPPEEIPLDQFRNDLLDDMGVFKDKWIIHILIKIGIFIPSINE